MSKRDEFRDEFRDVIKLAELVNLAELPTWERRAIGLPPAVWEYMDRCAQDVGVEISTVIALALSAQMILAERGDDAP